MAKLVWRGPKARMMIRKGAREAVASSTVIVQAKAIALLNRPGTGIVYIKRSGRVHQASSLGQPPATDTGALIRSVVVDTRRLDDINPRSATGTALSYGKRLEMGTSNIARRPWLTRALNESREDVKATFAKVMKRTGRLMRSQLRG